MRADPAADRVEVRFFRARVYGVEALDLTEAEEKRSQTVRAIRPVGLPSCEGVEPLEGVDGEGRRVGRRRRSVRQFFRALPAPAGFAAARVGPEVVPDPRRAIQRPRRVSYQR